MKKLFATLLVLISAILIMGMGARLAHSEEVLHYALSAQGCWVDAVKPIPDDFEGGLNVAASVQPHLALVGAAYYGFQHSYQRGSLGVRFTASNPDDPYFSVHVGGQYHFSSDPGLRAQGFAPDAAVGWVPWPQTQPAVILVMLGSYNIDANQAVLTAGVRYELGRHREGY
jgi:hypothetical protein